MQNLIRNAVDATFQLTETSDKHKLPPVLITTSCHRNSAQDYVKISVIDRGIGIRPDIVPRIFEPFFTTKQSDMNSGMGLTITRAIIESYGGTLDIETNDSACTTVSILLPFAGPAANGTMT